MVVKLVTYLTERKNYKSKKMLIQKYKLLDLNIRWQRVPAI